ncbi:unnamed protein product [Eruca vesicaria subsp. sativa]|uniref:ABC-type xenobiotic transporter n=1 Tax=Eruca vesicaria subsp. sativa TaxID=29727 RepID=A0ABC8KTM7_ERUVS|nr:unnamed protein product [Eruca vesicaria subsp. sativa]
MGFTTTLFRELRDLPLVEVSSISINLSLFLVSIIHISARRLLLCLRRGPFFKHDSVRNSSSVNVGDTREVEVTTGYKFSVLCCFFVLIVQVSVLVLDVVGVTKERNEICVIFSPVTQILAWLVLCASVVRCSYTSAEKFPLLLRLWWVVGFLICLWALFIDSRELVVNGSNHLSSHVVGNFVSAPALAFLCFLALRGQSGLRVITDSHLIEPLLVEQEEEKAGCLNVTSYSDAGLFSLATLSWLNPLLSLGAKRPLDLTDIPLLAPKDRAKTNYKILKFNWEKLKAENPSKPPSLAWAVLKSLWKEAACNAVFAGLNTLVSYVGPYLVNDFVNYLGGKETYPHEGYILAGIFFAAKLAETLTTRQWYLGVDILGMHVRSALTAMVYRKGLKLSSITKQNHTSGEIVNYMAVDVQRVGDYSWYLHDMWMLPLQIVLALGILYRSVGMAAVATLVATVFSILATIPLAKVQEDYQDKLMSAKDERMRKTSECLRNMRILKLQAWEDRSPIFVAAITFATAIGLGTQLTAGGVLSALATFRILQEPLRNFPDLVSMMAQTKVSLDRISGFLLEEELQGDATIILPQGVSDTSVEIKDGCFSWDPSWLRPTLFDIHLNVKRGMRVAVCGVVGSGKSSFLSCILGEIPKISGEVRICGSAAYVSQSAWIQSGNIEENILFGSPMDKAKYKNVIHACSLKRDLELFSHGDQTIIGDRGINLSGGQKQRVQLARALYQDADVYLLDDPFSAVDAHTGSELFKEYILTALADKTVIFVTHQVEFLPTTDLILVLRDGQIIQSGKYEELLQAGTDFLSLVSAHHEAIDAMDIPSHSSEDSDSHHVLDQSLPHNPKSNASSSNIEILAKEVQEGPSGSNQKAIKEKKKAKRLRKKQLVQEEERVRGRISMKVY